MMNQIQLENLPVMPLALLIDNMQGICENFSANEAVYYAHVILDQGMNEVRKIDLQLFDVTDEGLAVKVYERLVALKLI